jgi:hypothetical protein
MKKAAVCVLILVLVSILTGCAFIQGLIGLAGAEAPTAQDAEAVQAGIKAFIGLLTGDYAGALYWGAAACGGSVYAGGQATKAAGTATVAAVKKIAKKKAIDTSATT